MAGPLPQGHVAEPGSLDRSDADVSTIAATALLSSGTASVVPITDLPPAFLVVTGAPRLPLRNAGHLPGFGIM